MKRLKFFVLMLWLALGWVALASRADELFTSEAYVTNIVQTGVIQKSDMQKYFSKVAIDGDNLVLGFHEIGDRFRYCVPSGSNQVQRLSKYGEIVCVEPDSVFELYGRLTVMVVSNNLQRSGSVDLILDVRRHHGPQVTRKIGKMVKSAILPTNQLNDVRWMTGD